MKYLGTIKQHYDSSSRTFDTQKDAESWLDSQNNNAEHTTVVTIYDDNWEIVRSYIYTKGEE